MQIGVIGLGRMGGNIARRLMQDGHDCVVYDRDPKAVDELAKDGAAGADGLADLVQQLRRAARGLGDAAGRRDHRRHDHAARRAARPATSCIDGGNTFYRDDIRRAKALSESEHPSTSMSAPPAASGAWSAAIA